MDPNYYGSPQPSPYPNMMNNFGGYPTGYPPVVPQMGYGAPQPSPFMSPFQNPQPAPFIPGVTTPLEVEFKNGTTMNIPASGNYNPGGARVSPGGFNPATGYTTPPVGGQGFNPYVQFIGNPGYNAQQNQGFSPYVPPQCGGRPIGLGAAPMMFSGIPNYGIGGYGYGIYGGQNQFNTALQDILWNDESTTSLNDVKDMLAKAILTDEERAKISRRSVVTGYDYYGNPIYSDANSYYTESQRKQEAFQRARENHQKFYTQLSKIAHATFGETIDEEATMRRFDPVQTTPNQQLPIQTPQSREEYEKTKLYYDCANLDYLAQVQEARAQNLNNYKNYLYSQIKASHDKLLGFEPGQHYDLKSYMENGYKIGVAMAMQKSKSANRDGTLKYSRNAFRSAIASQMNLPSISNDDDCVTSVEARLKMRADMNKVASYIMTNQIPTGVKSTTTEPVFATEYDKHMFFFNHATEEKKKLDDIRKAVT